MNYEPLQTVRASYTVKSDYLDIDHTNVKHGDARFSDHLYLLSILAIAYVCLPASVEYASPLLEALSYTKRLHPIFPSLMPYASTYHKPIDCPSSGPLTSGHAPVRPMETIPTSLCLYA